ncbi:MAG: type II toxin-antitoxin system RelE/ParE family toxin, partial [Candidatus Eremiobacteraeota bacterium]|nr:type II toxin-antitoxin system RelE/ParE family toxin [Candidatus Eremiobacteraeota bacterium]
DRDTEALYHGRRVRRFSSFVRIAERKLVQLNNARSLRDLSAIPGNRLEALSGKRRGEYSMRINDQFRIVFRWHDDGPYDVQVEDYH